MDNHAYYQELISRMLDDDSTLAAEENADLQAHLATCRECAAVYDAFSALSGFVGGDLEEPPEELRANVMAEIRREEIRQKNRHAFHWVSFVAAAAVFALVIGFAPRLLAREDIQTADMTAQAAAGAVYAAPAAPAPAAEEAAANRAVMYDAADADSFYYEESAMENVEVDPNVFFEGVDPETGLTDAEAPYAEEEEKISMDALLSCLNGVETELDPSSLQLTPLYLIDTDAGVLQIYRYNNSLYYTDPLTGIFCEAWCSESALIRFLQD